MTWDWGGLAGHEHAGDLQSFIFWGIRRLINAHSHQPRRIIQNNDSPLGPGTPARRLEIQHHTFNFFIWQFWLNYCEPMIKPWSICRQFQNKRLFPGNNPWMSFHSLDYSHSWAEV
jgi:hypothetical protein